MGPALGAVAGGALGVASGLSLGTAAASVMIPGVGPVMATGLIGAALLGAPGAVIGAGIGDRLEDTIAAGLPKDELFVYKDALQQGRTVVIEVAGDESQATNARAALMDAGAESLDAARQKWDVGLRDAGRERYR
jgi:hypothetical protein